MDPVWAHFGLQFGKRNKAQWVQTSQSDIHTYFTLIQLDFCSWIP